MSFMLAYLFNNGEKKKSDYARQTANESHIVSKACCAMGDDEQSFPTLTSMIHSKSNPDPSPTSSASSQSPTTSIATTPTGMLETEELEDNAFYRYVRSHFNQIFSRSSVVCVPHSKSLDGMIMTREFVETHLYNPSPYYQEQYLAANGKVIMIEHPIISTVSGFKTSRTTCIISEELVYIARKKIKIIMIERPLEGDPVEQPPRSPNTISIPSTRCFKADYNFLTMFPENKEALHELQHSVRKFIDTYVYIRGFNTYTVDKIQNMYIRAHKTILERNKLLLETCRVQTEYDNFLELVENVVMGLLHEKIWVHSLRSILHSQDNYLESICRTYAKETITLSRYAVSHPIASMPLRCFQAAISCLQRVNAETTLPFGQNRSYRTTAFPSDSLAITPLEKLACMRHTLDLITNSVTNFVRTHAADSAREDDSPVTADEMIPLLAYILVHSHISRIASLAFYTEHFRLSMSERCDHSFVLVTLKAAIEFLKGDPLGLHDGSSEMSALSTISLSPTPLSSKHQGLRTRSSSVESQMFVSSSSLATLHYRSISVSSQPVSSPCKSHQMSSPVSMHNNSGASPRLRHCKSQSADLYDIADEPLQHNVCLADDTESSSASSSRRNSLSRNVTLRSSGTRLGSRETNRPNSDIPNEWMPNSKHRHIIIPPPIPTTTVTHRGRPASVGLPKTNHIGQLPPIVSTTFPNISDPKDSAGNTHDNGTNVSGSPYVESNNRVPSPLATSPTYAMRRHWRADHKQLDKRRSSEDSQQQMQTYSPSPESSPFSSKLYPPPKIISIHDVADHTAQLCISRRSVHHNEREDTNDMMGSFLRGLQSLDGNVVGEPGGSYRAV